jgi:predicted XRE-type DNA-binding protein
MIQNRKRERIRSRNVFRDLGFPSKEAEHLLIRSDLMIRLQEVINSRHLTQAEAAGILRVSQPRVSDLLRGRIDLFSTDTLIDMLGYLDVKVQLILKPVRRRRRRRVA